MDRIITTHSQLNFVCPLNLIVMLHDMIICHAAVIILHVAEQQNIGKYNIWKCFNLLCSLRNEWGQGPKENLQQCLELLGFERRGSGEGISIYVLSGSCPLKCLGHLKLIVQKRINLETESSTERNAAF